MRAFGRKLDFGNTQVRCFQLAKDLVGTHSGCIVIPSIHLQGFGIIVQVPIQVQLANERTVRGTSEWSNASWRRGIAPFGLSGGGMGFKFHGTYTLEGLSLLVAG